MADFKKRETAHKLKIGDILRNKYAQMAFLTNVNNMASANQCTIIAPINPGVFRKRDRFILEKIFDDVHSFIDDTELDDEE